MGKETESGRPAPQGRSHKSEQRLLGDGCGFNVVTGLVSVALMVFNGGLVLGAYRWLSNFAPSLLNHPRVAQASLFIVPVLLTFVQWWIFDRVVDRLLPGDRSSR